MRMTGHKIVLKIQVGESISCALVIIQKHSQVPRITLVAVTSTTQSRFTGYYACAGDDCGGAWPGSGCVSGCANATGYEPARKMPAR